MNDKNHTNSNTKEMGTLPVGKTFPVGPDGFVRLVDTMGSDDAIVQAARVSYGEGTKKTSEDRGLIRYLLRHRHTTPFEMCEIKLHVRVPMDCWRQWIRHRTANVNEYSTRYSIAIDSAATTQADQWRLQSELNKQGSGGTLSPEQGAALTQQETELQAACWTAYKERLELGIAREQARKDLPLSSYTEAYWKVDLHNLLHFLELRMESNAQYEIRQFANVIGNEIVRKWVPLTWEAFEDYRLDSMNLSSFEIKAIALVSAGQKAQAKTFLLERKILREDGDALKTSREGAELEEKLERLGIERPW